MPFRSHLDIFDLDKLPIESIRAFSLATDDREQDAIAKNVLRNYGLPGLRTLWLCQGLNCSARGVSVEPTGRVGITRATLWWLTSSSDEATAIKADFASVQNMNDANLLLGMCTRTPCFDWRSPENNVVFSPGACEDTASLLHAVHVRRLAQKYFSHLPEVASPLNYLYVGCYEVPEDEKDDPEDEEAQWDNIYFDPIGAFMDDPHALKFFAASYRSLPFNPPEWLLDFVKNGDTEWNVYKTLGIPVEQAYTLAVQNAAAPKDTLALPADVQLQGL